MPRLLGDIEGKIKHILISSRGPLEEHRIRGILRAFDEDVGVTIAYSAFNLDELPPGTIVDDPIEFHRNRLESIVQDVSPEREVNFIELSTVPTTWVQDLLHAYDNKRLISAWNENLPLKDEIINSREILRDRGLRRDGFKNFPNRNPLYVAGGDLIPVGGTLFVGEFLAQQPFEMANALNLGQVIAGLKYIPYRDNVVKSVRKYDNTRNTVFINPFTKEHIDMSFTPLSENVALVGEAHDALDFLDLPESIKPIPEQEHLADALDEFAKSLDGQFSYIYRIPSLPSLYDWKAGSGRRGSKGVLIGQSLRGAYNNGIQERYKNVDGEVVHKVYVAEFPVPGREPMPQHLKLMWEEGLPNRFADLDPDRFLELQQSAYRKYEDLGLVVVPVPFYTPGHEGALRCSVKVLERAA